MKTHKPTTPSRRHMTGIDFSQLSKKRPEKSLIKYVRRNSGRSASTGRITVRHKGGGVKQYYRLIEFSQTKMDSPAKVTALEYDPNRTAFIALIEYADKKIQYIVAPQNLKVGDEVIFAENAPLTPVVFSQMTYGRYISKENIPFALKILKEGKKILHEYHEYIKQEVESL